MNVKTNRDAIHLHTNMHERTEKLCETNNERPFCAERLQGEVVVPLPPHTNITRPSYPYIEPMTLTVRYAWRKKSITNAIISGNKCDHMNSPKKKKPFTL